MSAVIRPAPFCCPRQEAASRGSEFQTAGRHVDVAQDFAERSRLEGAIAVDGHNRIDVAAIEK
jgi:hypothetical protein